MFTVDVNFMKGTTNRFEGACIDLGAQLSVIGNHKAALYSDLQMSCLSPWFLKNRIESEVVLILELNR